MKFLGISIFQEDGDKVPLKLDRCLEYEGPLFDTDREERTILCPSLTSILLAFTDDACALRKHAETHKLTG